jgi:RimJ/RimL family protein N-acetyltransferase
MQLLPIEDSTAINQLLQSNNSEVLSATVAATFALYERKGFHPPWIGYLALEQQQVVGGCGFAGPPCDGEIEIAYFTFPGHENRGVATQMAKQLLIQSRPHATELCFIAHTLPLKGPSTRILHKLGFVFVGEINHPEDGLVWKWREKPCGA